MLNRIHNWNIGMPRVYAYICKDGLTLSYPKRDF